MVVIPTYNEAANLAWIVGRLPRADIDVLVVDDHSPDGTGRIADVTPPPRPGQGPAPRRKGGLGDAYLHGFAHALAAGYDVIGEMDADGSHQPEHSSRACWWRSTRADLVIGRAGCAAARW